MDTLRFATRALPELAQNLIKPGENGPLYFAALRPWLMLAGPTEFALRFPSVLAGTLAVPAVYILAKRLAGARAALVAALLAATAPYLVWYGQEAKMYAALTLLIPLALWWTTEAAQRGGLWRWAVLYADHQPGPLHPHPGRAHHPGAGGLAHPLALAHIAACHMADGGRLSGGADHSLSAAGALASALLDRRSAKRRTVAVALRPARRAGGRVRQRRAAGAFAPGDCCPRSWPYSAAFSSGRRREIVIG